jgi:hypothetical protein
MLYIFAFLTLQFVREFLRLDGSFVLRMLDLHTGEWVCAEIVDMIWEEFRRNDKKPPKQKEMHMPRQHKFEDEKQQQLPSKEPLQPQLPPSAAEHDNIEEDKMVPIAIGTRRRRSKVGLLAPLMARPVEEPNAAWASMPNLLWAAGANAANIGHPAFAAFGGMPSSSHQVL